MAEEAVLKYLESTNRPYSANDILLNLHKQFGKTAIQKALDALVASGAVLEKVYGKQKVYVIRQNDEDENTIKEAMKEVEETLAVASPQLQQLEEELKLSETTLKGLQSTMTTIQVLKEIDIVEGQIEEMGAALEEAAEAGDAPQIDPQVLNALKQEVAKNTKEYRYRKRLCMDMFNAILENYPKSKQALVEELGIETDECVNFKLEEI